MLPTVEIRDAREEDVAHIAANMRGEDVAEVWDSHMRLPIDAVVKSYAQSDKAWTGLLDGEPVIMFGVARPSMLSSSGIPWMLGTDKLVESRRNQLIFLRRNKKYVEEMKIGYNILENFVSMKNKFSVKWLSWLGFTIDEEPVISMTGVEFRRFHMEVS